LADEVFTLVGPDPKGGTEHMLRRADPLQPCVKPVRAPLRAGNSAMPLGGGLGLLEKADRFNAAEARVRMVCGECQRVRQFYLASMAKASALGMTASQDLSGS
jgi:hypothetical protein